MPDSELWDPCPLPSRPGVTTTLGVDVENKCPTLLATLSYILPGSLVVPWLTPTAGVH